MSPEEVLESLGLSGEYSQEAVDIVDAELQSLLPKILEAKDVRLKAKAAQQVLSNQRADLVAARGALMSRRTPQPGDVVVG